MCVLHVVGRLGMGGDSVVILSVKKYLQEQGVTFDFLTHKGCHGKTVEQVKNSGSKVWIFPGDVWRMGIIGYFFGVCWLLHKNHYDAIQFHTSLQSGVGLLAATIIGACIIGVLQNGMTLMGVSGNWQLVTKGVVVLTAAALDIIKKEKEQ